MIKSIIFDWGGVLINPPSEDIMSYCSQHLNVQKIELKKIYGKYKSNFQKATISEKQLWEKVCFSLKVDLPKTKSLWRDAFTHSYHERKDVFSIIECLKKNGYKIGFMSNTEIPSMEFFKECKYELFDVEIFSCLEKVRKPNIKIYEIGLNKLGVKPKESIFVDDQLENIIAAKKIKMNTIHYLNFNQFKNELIDLSVKL